MNIERVKLNILGLSSSHAQSGSFALILGEEGGKRRLPIIIGMFEAQSIAIEIEKIIPNRPLTHDLFKSFSSFFDINITEVYISDLKEGVFFAKIVCVHNEKKIEIDSRPSDAIAIGVRFNANIYVKASVLEEAGIFFDDETEIIKTPEKQTLVKESPLESLSSEELEVLLKEALENEDYEKAASIRDILNKWN